MKTLLILSAFIGFTLPEKLDRTYLPPPGSKFSGGSPGAIDVPLEFPKETYFSSLQDKHFRRPEITIGINTVSSNIPEKYGDITSTLSPLHGNSYGIPTTSMSHAISQTTPYLPAQVSTIEPDVSIDSKYPSNNSINIFTPENIREKNPSFDHAGPNNVYSVEQKQMLNDIKNILENPFPDNRINSRVVNKINDESLHSNNGDFNNIPKINSYSDDLGISGTSSTPAEIDHSLVNNNYDTYQSPPPSEPISKHNLNLISPTPMPIDNGNSKTPSKYVSTTPISSTDAPYSYRPERIQAQDRDAVILNYDNTITPGGYAYSFDTSNGIHADEKGIALNGVQAVGSYSYIGDDGQLYSVNYTADENGFRPYGAHLPTAPPIPDAILKVIEQAAIDKANGIYDDGSYDENKYGYQKYNPTKNVHFLNQYNKNRKGNNSNISKNNTKLPHNPRLEEKVNKVNDKNEEKEQIVVTNNQLQPFMKNELANEAVSEISPNYKSENIENNGKDYIDMSNDDYKKKFQNKMLNAMPNLNGINRKKDGNGKEDKIMNIEFYDETGYHYSKPPNDYTLKAADKLKNKFSETPATINIPAMYKKKIENVPIIPTFMTPYILQNNDIFIEHDGDDQSINIPVKYHEEENVKMSNVNSPFPLAETRIVPGDTENRIIHNSNNHFKQSDPSPFNDQGNLYGQNVNSNNDTYVPYISSTEIGLSDIISTVPTAFPSRFNSMTSNKDNNFRNPSKNSESSFLQNQAQFSNPLLDQEKYRGTITHSNTPDNYANNINDDITDSRSRFNTPNMYGADKDYIKEHSTPKTLSEDFSGPKQPQKYNPLTGYHY